MSATDPNTVHEFISWLNQTISFLEGYVNDNELSGLVYWERWKDAHMLATQLLSPSDVELLEPEPQAYMGIPGWAAIHKLKRLRNHLTGEAALPSWIPAPDTGPHGEALQRLSEARERAIREAREQANGPPAVALPEEFVLSLSGEKQRKLLRAVNGKASVPIATVLTAVYGTKETSKRPALLKAKDRVNGMLAKKNAGCEIRLRGETLILSPV